jgi:hypothetical protein
MGVLRCQSVILNPELAAPEQAASHLHALLNQNQKTL